jgi:hypothetical protein
MAYVVARRKGRFEVRESLHTQRGPRARTLAGFGVLTDEVLTAAAARAQRPFNAREVLASGRRAGAPVLARIATNGPPDTGEVAGSASRFVESSRRMALTLSQTPAAGQTDPGAALIDLLGFADAVTRSQPARPFEPLTFPVLHKLVEHRHEAAGTHSG